MENHTIIVTLHELNEGTNAMFELAHNTAHFDIGSRESLRRQPRNSFQDIASVNYFGA
jgi:hypothetical protein